MLQQVAISQVGLEGYYRLLDEESITELERLSTRLRGLKVAHLNTTSMGGAVAGILRSLVPLMNGVGVHTDW